MSFREHGEQLYKERFAQKKSRPSISQQRKFKQPGMDIGYDRIPHFSLVMEKLFFLLPSEGTCTIVTSLLKCIGHVELYALNLHKLDKVLADHLIYQFLAG
jgi:hypothetical protein